METTYSCNVVIDLEFTNVPRDRRVDGLATEIIEIGAVKVAADGPSPASSATWSSRRLPPASPGLSVA